ncbi:hypothetical protein [Methylocaldum marinum]|uniref:hypothetical protein n=1 Tax=Methylocaldum marinum TaxID=1432792 RepID=UPI0011AE4A36|nr:hypothetical protein [Methylocaldum marinum]
MAHQSLCHARNAGGFKNSHKSELGTVISFSEREFDRERVAGVEALDMDRAAVRQMDRQRAQAQMEVGWPDPGAEAQSIADRPAAPCGLTKSSIQSMLLLRSQKIMSLPASASWSRREL